MNKSEFLCKLREGLAGLPTEDVEERISFYSEMIDDRVEDGLGEEEAVEGIGDVDEIVSRTVADIPISKLVKEKIAPKRSLRAWEIVLIVLGSPIWLSLLIAVFAIALSVYIVLWALIVSLWAIEVSFIACALASLAAAVIYFIEGFTFTGIAMFGVGLFFAGLSIFLFFGCVAASKGMARLTKKIALKTKTLFIRKETSK
jgi:uncharacterized membrane protein